MLEKLWSDGKKLNLAWQYFPHSDREADGGDPGRGHHHLEGHHLVIYYSDILYI